jgi:hypothetical protein
MKTKLLFLLSIFLLFVSTALPQTNLLPLNFKNAYKNGTRSLDGMPGKNYWQNKSDYKIKAKLDPKSRSLTGSEEIVYFNESPDTLKQIVLRIYQDIYRKGNARDFSMNAAAVNDGTEIKKVVVNGTELKLSGDKYSPIRDVTNLFLPLEKFLAPKEKINLELEWSIIIPNKSQVRMGAYDSTSFFVAYWYPQVAVYDDIDGWDMLNYTGQTEMYNDFNNYEVEISVPKGFLLWSTGVLQNPEEVFSQNILEKFNNANQSDSIINIIENKDYENGTVTSDKENLTYKIKADYVPDFAFATSDHYLWDASSLVVDKSTGRRAFISAAYNKSTKDFATVADVARKSIESFSTHMPGVPYPYPCMTVFNGEGGMEFPMMCNDSAVPELWGTVHLTSHEISHTYFPFYMGINERKYAWMDEGWATMLPFDFQTENAPGYDPRSRNAQSYSDFAGDDTDLPMMVPSHQLRGASYRTASYRRPGAAYDFLRQMLGDQKFKSALHEYMKRWNGKHPVPYDFFFTFNNVLGEDLSWYWKPWFFENKYPDLSIDDLKLESGMIKLKIKNIGGIPLPVILKAYYQDGTNENVFNKNADVWKNSADVINVNFAPSKKVIKVELGTNQIPDADNSGNVFDIK